MKHCAKCGAENPDTAKFCKNCGADLSSVKVVKEGRKKISKKNNKNKKKLWLSLVALIVIIIGLIGYKQVYVPNKVSTIVEDDGFSNNMYKYKLNKEKHTVYIFPTATEWNNIYRDAKRKGAPNKKMPIDNKLQNLANDIHQIPLSGKWQIRLVARPAIINQSNKHKLLTEALFVGVTEKQPFYESEAYKELKEEVEDQQRKEEEDERGMQAMGQVIGAVGDIVGSFNDSLNASSESQQNMANMHSFAQEAGQAAAETPH